MTYFFNTAFPRNAVILFFKATQLGLFEDIVPIKGHMRDGHFIKPTMGKRRKAREKAPSGDLFAHLLADTHAEHKPATEVKKPAPRKPRPLSPEKLAFMQAKINQMLAHAKVDAQHAPKQGSVHKKLYLAQLEAMKGIPEDVLEKAKQDIEGLFKFKPAPEKKPETDPSKIDYNAIKNTLRDNPSVETVLSVAETLGIGSTPKRYLGDTEIIRLGSIMGYKNPSSLPRDLAKEKARLDVVSVVGFINTKADAAKAKSKASADASARVKAVMAHIDRKRSTGESLTDDEQAVLHHATAARTAHEDAAAHVSRANAMDQEWASDRAAGHRGTVDVLAATGLGPHGVRKRAVIARAEAKKHQEKAVEAAQRVKVAAQPVSAAPAPEKKPEVAPAEPEKPDQSKEMAYRGSRISVYKIMNNKLRSIDPRAAYSDEEIENASNLNEIQDYLSEKLSHARQGDQSAKLAEPAPNKQLNAADILPKLEEIIDDRGNVTRGPSYVEELLAQASDSALVAIKDWTTKRSRQTNRYLTTYVASEINMRATRAKAAEQMSAPPKPKFDATKEPWQMTMGEYIARHIDANPLPPNSTPRQDMEVKDAAAWAWIRALTERAKQGRVSDVALDDYLKRFGQRQFMRKFGGARSPGIEGYTGIDPEAMRAKIPDAAKVAELRKLDNYDLMMEANRRSVNFDENKVASNPNRSFLIKVADKLRIEAGVEYDSDAGKEWFVVSGVDYKNPREALIAVLALADKTPAPAPEKKPEAAPAEPEKPDQSAKLAAPALFAKSKSFHRPRRILFLKAGFRGIAT